MLCSGGVGVWWEGPAAANRSLPELSIWYAVLCTALRRGVGRARVQLWDAWWEAVAAWAAPCRILAQFKLRPSYCTSQRGCRARAVDTFTHPRPTPPQPASPPDGEPPARPWSGSAAVPAFTQFLLQTV